MLGEFPDMRLINLKSNHVSHFFSTPTLTINKQKPPKLPQKVLSFVFNFHQYGYMRNAIGDL